MDKDNDMSSPRERPTGDRRLHKINMNTITHSEMIVINNELFRVPNMEIGQLNHYIKSCDKNISENAKEKLLHIIKENEMSPYYKFLNKNPSYSKYWDHFDNDLYEKLYAKNTETINEMDAKLELAKETSNESCIVEILIKKAIYLTQIGDKDEALSALRVIQETSTTIGMKLDVIFCQLRIGFLFQDKDIVSKNLEKAQDLIILGNIDWDRKNRLKLYSSLDSIRRKDFNSSSNDLSTILSTFTYTEMISYDDFVIITITLSLLCFSKNEFNENILNSPDIYECLQGHPWLENLIKCFNECDYRNLFHCLYELNLYLKNSVWLHNYHNHIIKELRIKMYKQYLEPYLNVNLVHMADNFGVNLEFIDNELYKWISRGRLNVKIDKVNNIIVKCPMSSSIGGSNREFSKNDIYQEIIKNGDILLSRLQNLSRIVNTT